MLIKFFSNIPPYIKLILKLYGLHLLIFSGYRIFFYFMNMPKDVEETLVSQRLFGFRMGLEFDTALIAYASFLPSFLLSINHFSNYRLQRLNRFSFVFFMAIVLLYQFVYAADIPYFKQFGSHLNKQALLWQDEGSFMFGLIFGDIGYWGYIFLFIASSVISIYFSRKIFKRYLLRSNEYTPLRSITSVLFFASFCTLTVYAARGRVSPKSPLHEGLAVVSDNGFVNSIALNPNFTFWKSLLYNHKDDQYQVPPNIKEHIAFTRKYLGITSPFEENIARQITSSIPPKNYNVVVVIMESMSVFKMGYYGGKNLTPHLSNIIKGSVFFDHFFSSGIHTFNGLFSTNSGYPSILNEQGLKRYLKSPFSGFGHLLKEQGYQASYFTSHDPHFDNMSGFFKLNGFDKIISQYDMPAGSAVSELGVPDHVLFDRFIEETNSNSSEKPFVSVIMTSSDHGPWVIPDNIPFKPNGETKEENSTLYADWSLGYFMKKVKQQKWYDNTIFLFLGDHGLSMGHTYEMPLSYNHVPFVVHHPSSLKPDTISSPGYQPDVTATIMGLLNRNYTNETFGIDLFKEKHSLVMFSADDKIGCVNDKGFFYFKLLNTGITRLRKYEDLDKTEFLGTHKNMADSMDKAMTSILETARYFVRKNHFVY